MGQFGVSQSVLRREDEPLLRGQGRFVDDRAPAGTAHGFVLRSPHGHAAIDGIDVSAAAAAPGVLAVHTATDLKADGVGDIPCVSAPAAKPGTPFRPHLQSALAHHAVRYAGDPVAFVVAETAVQARDAAELIEVDYADLPAVTECVAAARPDAPKVWADDPDNICFEWEMGDKAATDAAFAAAAHVVALEVVNNRVVLSAIETRGAVGEFDAGAGKFTLHTVSQMPHSLRDQLAENIFGVDKANVRVVIEDVGGGFGGKNSLYPEQILVLHAARKLGRPVKWIGERADAFLSDYHGRDNVNRGALALDAEGRFLAVRASAIANLGGYIANRGAVSPVNGYVMLSNTYVIPALHAEVKAVYTNTVPTDPYRGAGRPEVLYLVERLIDAAAHDLGIDRVDLRRRNCIPADAFPYASPTGLNYDAADFAMVMDAALEQSAWAGLAARRAEATQRGRLRGIGMANYIERCGGGGGLSEAARVRFEPDGAVTVFSGSMANGQGHATAFSQIVNEWLGVPFDKITIVEGDTDRVATGTGTGGSWSAPMGGGAICHAADKIIDKARRIAAHLLEAAEADLEFADGAFTVAGTDLVTTLSDVAGAAHDPANLPDGMAPGLDEDARFVPDNYTFPYGCHICEVEIDPETGAVEVVGYTAVHDFGRALNPLLLAGQVHGGLAQGLGQALSEHTVYDAAGQMLSGSFMDYGLPRADDLPSFDFVHRDTPSPRNPLGVKGCGEAGAAGSPPAVINAIVDALSPHGVRHVDMPATPQRVWRVIRDASDKP